MTDQSLYENFLNFGRQALAARNKCIGLLPEIHRRKIHQQKGFNSIYEFAAKLAGLRRRQVNLALNLERRLVDKPELHQAFTSGQISLYKMIKIISIATSENQSVLLSVTKKLSTRALETLVRDEKTTKVEDHNHTHVSMQENIFPIPGLISDSQAMAQKASNLQMQPPELQLDEEVQSELLELQRKGLDVNQLLKEFLHNRREKIATEKTMIAEEQQGGKFSRYIPVKVRRILVTEHGNKCSIPTCQKPSQHLHHTQRFSLAHSHNPHYIAPLCREHHQIAHAIDGKVAAFAMN